MRALLAIALLLAAQSAAAEPFFTTDQNPLLAGFLLSSDTARLPASGTSDLLATLNWSNTALIQRSDEETLVADIESREWLLSFQYGFADNFALRIQLPYRAASGGKLDRLIENWHSLLGLPNGDRSALPQNDLRVNYQRGSQTLIAVSNDTAGVGDISFAVGYQLSATPKTATSVWLTIKAPTGDSTKLTGSGAADVSANIAVDHQLSTRWSVFAHALGAYLGTGNLLPEQQRHWLASGQLGFDYRYSQALTLTVQLDGHTAIFKDSQLDLLGNAWILTTGGEYRWASHWRAQFGIGEDVKVGASPDVNFVFSVGKDWR